MSYRIPTAQVVAAFATIGAAAVHIAVAAEHWSLWWGYGVQFVAAAVVQVGWAIAALRSRSRTLLGTGAVLQAVFVGAWVFTRTLGQPIGPAAGTAEPVGIPGTLTVLLELVAVAILVTLWVTGGSSPSGKSRYAAAVGGGGVAVLAIAFTAVFTAMGGGHHGTGGHHSTGGHHGTAGHHGTGNSHSTGDHHGGAERSPSSARTPAPGDHRPTGRSETSVPAPTSEAHEHDHQHG